jgi:low temperature requirement protein LtrA
VDAGRGASAAAPRRASLMRARTGAQRVTNVELFFDLVFVFAVTQLSHFLLTSEASRGAGQTAFLAGLLLTMVWLLWAYTTWVTNCLDPDKIAVRLLLLLLVLALISLISSAALPTAFSRSGLIVGGAYLVMQVALFGCATAVIVGVAAADQIWQPPAEPAEPAVSGQARTS